MDLRGDALIAATALGVFAVALIAYLVDRFFLAPEVRRRPSVAARRGLGRATKALVIAVIAFSFVVAAPIVIFARHACEV